MTTPTLVRVGDATHAMERPKGGGPLRARRPWLPGAASVVAYLAIGAFAYLHAWSAGIGQVVHGCGCSDQALNAWFLNWDAFALLHLHNPFFSSWLNVPGGVNLMSNTAMPVLGVLAAPVTWAFGSVATYNMLLFLAFPASAAAAYFVLHRWTRRALPAFIGGLVYGFSPYLVGQDSSHLHLSFVAVPPLVLLALDEIFVRQRGRPWIWGVFLGLLAVAEFGISAEVLATTALLAVVGAVVLALLHRHDVVGRLPYVGRAVLPAALVFIVFAGYPLWWMLAGPQHTVGPPQGIFGLAFRADLLGPILPTSNQLITLGSLTNRANGFSGGLIENGSYLGLPFIILLIAIVIAYRRRGIVVFFAIMTAITFVLSLGTALTVDGHAVGVPLPFTLIAKLPLFNGVLAVRLSLYIALFAAVLVSIGMDAFIDRWAGSPGAVAGAVTLVVALLPLVPAFPYAGFAPTAVPSYFTSSSVDRIPKGSVVVSYPAATNYASQFELWQVASDMRFRLPLGYAVVPQPNGEPEFFSTNLTSSTFNSLLNGQVPAETPALRRSLRAQWRSWGVRTVLFAPIGTDPDRAEKFLGWVLGRPATASTGGITAWYDALGPTAHHTDTTSLSPDRAPVEYRR